ncbi:hypothetical protein YC2023_109115 [Brassica napus]
MESNGKSPVSTGKSQAVNPLEQNLLCLNLDALFVCLVVEVFEESEGRKHGECSLLDLATVLEIKKKLCEVNSVSESHIPDSLLERLISGTIEFPPACAIVGGILAQEVIKAVSGKGDPVKNFFYYDAQDGKGVMEDISNSFTS